MKRKRKKAQKLQKLQKEKLKQYAREYYLKNKKRILKEAKEKYFNTKKKTPKCKMCGKLLPKELTAHTKYCDQCLYSRGHGADAHRMAAVRWFRKNYLTNEQIKDII